MFLYFACALCILHVAFSEECSGLLNRQEICCDAQGLGCFRREAPWDGLPLPCCQEWGAEVEFRLFTRRGRQQYADVLIDQPLPAGYNSSLRTVFISHGWMGSGDDDGWLPQLKDAFLDKFDYNIIVISWATGAGKLYYPEAASTVRVVGAMAARVAGKLVGEAGAEWRRLWCVGHSLGAHVCGHMGMRVPRTLGRITGLDPAGPWFEGAPIEVGLNPNCAEMVDVIHTDTKSSINTYGTTRPIGHMDFYPNGLGRQPGCVDKRRRRRVALNPGQRKMTPPHIDTYGVLGCSHGRSNTFFIDALVTGVGCFPAAHVCDQVQDDMPAGCQECTPGECPEMGWAAENNPRPGNYYLTTNPDYPDHCTAANDSSQFQDASVLSLKEKQKLAQ